METLAPLSFGFLVIAYSIVLGYVIEDANPWLKLFAIMIGSVSLTIVAHFYS